MTSAVTPGHQSHVSTTAPFTAPGTTNPPLSRAVPAQPPGRSYATVSKTATPTQPTPAGASAPAQHAKPLTESPVNGSTSMAQGGSQSANNTQNGTPSHADHGRKPSVVISASGATGYTPNGGPVGQSNGRPPINFGSMNTGGSPLPGPSVPYQSHTSLPTPPRDPRATSPAHSPSPIPQPPTSGGRPPSGLQNQSNGMTFGSLQGDGEQMRQGQMSGPMGPGIPMHERRQSSQSMQSDMSNPSMNRNFMPSGGRGRGFTPQPYGMPSPAQQYRQVSNPGRPQSIQQPYGQMSPAPPFNRGNTRSPAISHAQPSMHPGMAGNPQMPYGSFNPQMGHQQQHNMYPQFDPQQGYYQPYWYQQGPSQSPRPGYPSPYQPPPAGMQPPFHPPSMSRSTSQASERPASSMGQPQTPSMQPVPPAQQTPASAQPQSSQANFVRPKKTSSAIKITDAQGNAVDFRQKQPSPSTSTQPQTPVIVSTPNAPTPPPRAPSEQHNRVEHKSTKTAEETKNAFQEQVKRQLEEEKRRKEAEEAAKNKPEVASSETSKEAEVAEIAPAADPVKEAVVEAEKAAAVDAGDKEGEKSADTAASALVKDADKKEPQEETEDERIEREIAEMEAAEKEEEEREKAFQEKRNKEKAEAARKDAEAAAKADEELKRQEREAEEREEQREREREAEKKKQEVEDDAEAKDSFATLAKPKLGPGAETPASGADTPASEDADATSMPPPAQPGAADAPRAVGAQKPKPAHLKLETNKGVEPSEPTPGMQALKTARFLEIKEEAKYPDGFKSPNPALNNAARKARAYDKDFLLQFQSVFKEKPSVDWDQRVRDTLGPGDEPGSARAQSARTPSSNMGRAASGRPGVQPVPSFSGAMGAFGQPRTLPPGTTSQERFIASTRPGGMGAMPMGRVPSQQGMGSPNIPRTNSLQHMPQVSSNQRQTSSRGKSNVHRGGPRGGSTRNEAEMAAKMPLTAHQEVAPLTKSNSGWKPTSIGAPMASQPDLSGNMAPDMVQRKVKAALNKMTPDNFERISEQILTIAAQSKNESDGRTLRQVIQLTFEKACDEAHWAAMYAQFCAKMLTSMSTEIRDETIKDKAGSPVVGGALFRKYLLNRCQEEFERGWQVNLPDKPEGESQEAVLLSDEYYIAAAAKRRGLGLIVFIGQLYKLKMLTLRIMHECVLKLLNFEGEPDEAAVETLTTLLRTVGASIEAEDKGPAMMDAYFERIDNAILKGDSLASRPRFMVMDLIDLRKARWRGKDDAKGPKTITEIREEAEAAAARAEAEKARAAQRGGPGGRAPMGRGDARNFSGGMQPPVDYQRTTVGSDDLRRLQNRNQSARSTGGALGPGGSLGPGGMMLGARAGSRRGAGGLAAGSSGNTTRTNTPPAESKEKKEESSSQNAFGALASLDPSGEVPEDGTSPADATSPPAPRLRSKSPLTAGKAEESTS